MKINVIKANQDSICPVCDVFEDLKKCKTFLAPWGTFGFLSFFLYPLVCVCIKIR